MGRSTIRPALSVRVWPAGMSLSHRALATPVAGRVQCTLTQSPGVRCFLQHIGLVGIVSRSSAAWLGCVSEDTRLSTVESPESVRDLQRWDKTVTTNWISRNWGEKGSKFSIFLNKHLMNLPEFACYVEDQPSSIQQALAWRRLILSWGGRLFLVSCGLQAGHFLPRIKNRHRSWNDCFREFGPVPWASLGFNEFRCIIHLQWAPMTANFSLQAC